MKIKANGYTYSAMAEWSESVAQKGEDLGSTPGGADAVFVWLTILPNSSGWLHLPKGVGTDHKRLLLR